MNKTTRVLLIVLPILLLAFAVWQLGSLLTFIVIAFVISMIGQPLVGLLGRIRFGSWHLPRWTCALLTLFAIWILFFSFFRFFIPLLAEEFKYFASLDMQSFLSNLDEPISQIEGLIDKYNLSVGEDFTVMGWANDTFSQLLGLDKISGLLSGIAGAIGKIFVGFLVVSFTSFFFMKEAHLFENTLVLFFPEEQEQKIRNALSSISHFLKRYFIGVMLQTSGIILLNLTGLSIVGLEFDTAATIALLSGVLNVIPYVGPLIGLFIGLFVGAAVNIPMDFTTELVPLLVYILIAMEITQIIDNVVFQPLIFSKSVMAHPLEIFLVIIAAGTIGGVLGMILAVPSYTVIRVIAKEFLSHSKLVQKLTERL